MVYTGPVNRYDLAMDEYMAARERSLAFAELDDPEYEWAREQLARVDIDIPPVEKRHRPSRRGRR